MIQIEIPEKVNRLSGFFPHAARLGYDKARPVLNFHIDIAEIVADDAEADHDQAAEEQQQDHGSRQAGDDTAHGQTHDRHDADDKRSQERRRAAARDEVQRQRREGRDVGKRIFDEQPCRPFRLACGALAHLIGHLRRAEADPRRQGTRFSRMDSSTFTALRSSSLKSEARVMSMCVASLMRR